MAAWLAYQDAETPYPRLEAKQPGQVPTFTNSSQGGLLHARKSLLWEEQNGDD